MFYKEEIIGNLKLIEIKNKKLRIKLLNMGASIHSIYFNNKLMTETPDDLNDFINPNVYNGKTIGVISNRVKNGQISINNIIYKLDLNENKNSLHGGLNGLSNQLFDVEYKENKDCYNIIFKHLQKDLIDGLPGNRIFEITYSLSKNENIFNISFKATSDKDTVIGLTNHTYFNLGDNNINNLSLKLKSKKYVEPNFDDLTPNLLKNITNALDFNEFKLLNKDINNHYLKDNKTKGYDHHFILDDGVIELKNNEILLNIKTDFSGVQIYTDNYANNIKMIDTECISNRGVAIEPQDNTLERKIIKKDESYIRFIKYSFYNI